VIELEPVTGALGAIVRGVNLANAGADELGAARSALDEHLVCYFPGQDLDRFQLSKLARFFGPPFLHPLVNNGFDDCPDVLELRREPDETIMFGGASWHADVTWLDPCGYASILHAKIIPSVGGDTAFASTVAAFSSLSDGLKASLRSLTAIHNYYGPDGEEDECYMAVHPVVRRHPATGREGLYLNRMFVVRFEGMTKAESAPLLGHLYDHMERHEFTCRFRWASGGVVMWDNRFTLHFPIKDFSRERRIMIRTTVLDNEALPR